MRTDDSGMTLIELLVSMVISVILVSVVGAAFIMAIRINTNSRSDLAESADTQLSTAYLPGDLLSIGPGGLDRTVTASTACLPTADIGDRIAKFEWTERRAGAAVERFVAEYRVRPSGDEWQLVRLACSAVAPATPANAAPDVQLVAKNLRAVAGPGDLPTVQDDGTKVSIVITTAEAADGTTYTYSLTGTRRTPLVLTAPPPPPDLPALEPLLPRVQTIRLRTNATGDLRIELQFSGIVPQTCATAFGVDTETSLRNYLPGTAVIPENSTVATLPLARVANTDPITSSTDLAVSLAGETSTCQVTSFDDSPVVDSAPPLLLKIVTSGGTARRFESGDSITLTFSEPVSNLPRPLVVQMNGGNNNQSDGLSIPGVLTGTASLGRTDYMTGNRTASASGAWNPLTRVEGTTLTISTCPSTGGGNCADSSAMTTAGPGGGTFTFRQVGTLTDGTNNSMANQGIAPVDRSVLLYEAF